MMGILWSEPCTVTCQKADLCDAILGSRCYACCMCTVAGAMFNGVRRTKVLHSPIAVVGRVVPERGTMHSSPPKIIVLDIDTSVWWTGESGFVIYARNMVPVTRRPDFE